MSNIRAKIEKLLKKAASTTFEGEAEALMAMAQRLMEEHQISEFELGGSDDPLGTSRTKAFQINTIAQYRYRAEAAVAEYFGCVPIIVKFHKEDWEKKQTGVYELHGPESSRITAELMFPFIWKQVLESVKKESEVWREDPAFLRKAKRELTRQVVEALVLRLRRLKAAPKVEAPTAAGQNALVLIQNSVAEYVKSRYSSIDPGKPRKVRISQSAKQMAEGISLNLQTEEEKEERALLG